MPTSRIKPVWTNTYRVSAADVDHHSAAKLTSLCNYFQESAWEHAANLLVGYDDVIRKNLAWVLSRLRIKVERYPLWKEDLILETWPKGMDGPFALRDFSIISSKGELCARGASAWLLVDLNSKRPARLEEHLAHILHLNDGVHSIEEKLPKLKEVLDSKEIRTMYAGYTDLDANAHVNNVRYISWACDALEEQLFSDHQISDFTINFLAETKMGEYSRILRADLPNHQYQVEGILSARNQASFRALMELRPMNT